MSRIARAEAALVDSLRRVPTKKSSNQETDGSSIAKDSDDFRFPEDGNDIPSGKFDEDEATLVRKLEEMPSFDKTRKFPGLAKQKVSKKDKHMKAVDNFAQTLDNISENLEQEVLNMSRDMRGKLESIDQKLQIDFKTLDNDSFLITKSEADLLDFLEDLKKTLSDRSLTLESFAQSLDDLESRRAATVGKKLKDLVDELVAIAHQLRDEIEYIVESETADLNSVLITNRKSHAELMMLLRKGQVEMEVETLQRWEYGREKWRKLRHDKAFHDFQTEIHSDAYEDPSDRNEFMNAVRDGQMSRQHLRHIQLQELEQLSAKTINSDSIVRVQQIFGSISESEVQSIQDGYNGLCQLRQILRTKAERRVEALRKELHTFGALKLEPNLPSIVEVLRTTLNNPELDDLFRKGGGLKNELSAMASEMSSDDMAYDSHVNRIRDRLEIVCCGFGIKAILEKRGRLVHLEKVRGLLNKMRSVTRADSKDLVTTFVADLEEIVDVDAISSFFRKVIAESISEMHAELERVQRVSSGLLSETNSRGTKQSTLKSASKGGKSGTASKTKRGGTGATGLLGGSDDEDKSFVDPLLMKSWSRRLGILYFGSDLPQDCQDACVLAVDHMMTQRQCNDLVDAAVTSECDSPLSKLDRDYKRLIDGIANFMENQAGFLNTCANNLCSFFLKLSKATEAHRNLQTKLDEKSADELFDLSEDCRIEREDRELQFKDACQVLRQSTSQEQLQENFKAVLDLLDVIQESYRIYHGKACFAADKYPLVLVGEFFGQMEQLGTIFEMTPSTAPLHPLLGDYDRIYTEVLRLNKKFFADDPMAAGVGPRLPPLETGEDEGGGGAPGQAENTAPLSTKAAPAPVAASPPAKGVKGQAPAAATPAPDHASHPPTHANVAPTAPMPEPTVEFYPSPNFLAEEARKAAEEDQDSDDDEPLVTFPPIAAYFGKFVLKQSLKATVTRFTEDTGNAEDGDTSPSNSPSKPVGSATGETATNVDETPERPETHPDHPYFKVTNVTAHFPLPKEQVDGMADEVDKEEYMQQMLNAFVELGTDEVAALDSEKAQRYHEFKTCVDDFKILKAKLADPAYQREHPPLHRSGKPWVYIVEITISEMQRLAAGIRDSLIEDLEKEAFVKLKFATTITKDRKDLLTDELEDRLRTHWPRRGRVETQVKQPREAELLSHQEKTWRHIQAVTQRMADTQEKFMHEDNSGRTACDSYVQEITTLRNALTSQTYRNLAVLQGIDAKARAATIKFTASAAGVVHLLQTVSNVETAAIIQFAKEFKKICPPQVPGVDGGYSEAELEEIERLIDAQCVEIEAIAVEWNEVIEQLKEQQIQSLKSQEEFTKKYEKVANDVAMSEGLGQTYGAPRRRAQERLRTEVSRDEQAAGKVDELLAQLDYVCSEAKRKETEGGGRDDDADSVASFSSLAAAGGKSGGSDNSNGYSVFHEMNNSWSLLLRARSSIQLRCGYLAVIESALTYPQLDWVPEDRITNLHAAESEDDLLHGLESAAKQDLSLVPESKSTILDLYHDVDATCRQETRSLYEKEGKLDMLGTGGVPQSLEEWLHESKEKLLGRHGYRERAWKRLWGQVERLECIVARRGLDNNVSNADDEEEEAGDQPAVAVAAVKVISYRLGAPAVCLRYMAESAIQFIKYERKELEAKFIQLVRAWEKGREKHERLLRPRLGSPDAADELSQLDSIETERSSELSNNVIKFRSSMVLKLVERAKIFVADLSLGTKSLIGYIDSAMRQEVLQVPPDTEIPKKRMTLKRMRKAQRLRHEVAQGAEDRSTQRTWPPLPLDPLIEVAHHAEDMVPDLESLVAPPPAPAADAAAAKGKPKKGEPAAPPPVAAKPSLVPASWLADMQSVSAVKGAVSSAHRALLQERDSSFSQYTCELALSLEEVRDRYGNILKEEGSWKERWDRQVQMLRKGDL